MDIPDYGDVLRSLHDLPPTAVADSVAALARRAGAADIVVYLADFEQVILMPVPGRGVDVDAPVAESVSDSSAGAAFREQRTVSEARTDGTRVWVPLLEGPDCTGVLALSVTGDFDDGARHRCEELGMMAGSAVSLAARYTDLYNMMRRRKAMTLPASMQWDLLPPLCLRVPEATSTGILEPAYDVGGDCFDHAVNGSYLDLVLMDAMGHGLSASVTSALAIGAYRHDRREGRSLAAIHRRLDEVIAQQFPDETFVTGIVARLSLRSGELTWINAGHPAPLHVRGGRVLGRLECEPSLPWGLGSPVAAQGSDPLEPGDSILFYTDGLIEGRSPAGAPFGDDRLVDLVERAAQSATTSGAALRILIDDVLTYQERRLRDDATMVWVEWRGPSSLGT